MRNLLLAGLTPLGLAGKPDIIFPKRKGNAMQIKPYIIALALAGLPALAAAPAAMADDSPVYTGTFSDDALQGYDAVAYFKQGKAVEGEKKFSTRYKGAEWKFSSLENLNAFISNPEKYAPQYGGHCAWAAAQGKTAKGDAKNWTIVDDKLYLNYNDDIQSKWETDKRNLITQADAKWPEVIN